LPELSLILGLAAAFLTTFALLPQTLKAIRTKHTTDLSLPMILMLETGLLLWLVYGLLINSIPVIAANTISVVFMTILLILKLRYK